MDKILKISPLTQAKFVKPISLEYQHKGRVKIWEAVLSHDSVSILLWHRQRDAFVIVKQLRPPVLNTHPEDGYMHELCAGIVDKDLTLEVIAQEEILEECGYDVPLETIQRVTAFHTSVGISGAQQTLYFAAIDDSMKVSEGGGLDEEDIEVIYLPVQEAKKFIFDESYQKTPGMTLAFYWFFDNLSKLMQTQ